MRIKALILSLVIFVSSLPALDVGAVSEEAENLLYFCENFDSAKGGSVKSLEFGPKSNEILIHDDNIETGDRAAIIKMKCTQEATADASIVKRFTDIRPKGQFVIEYSMMLNNIGGCSPRLALRSPESGGNEIYPIQITASGQMLAIDGGEILSSVAEGKYYNMALAFDFDKGTYDIYVNGLRKKQGVNFKSNIKYSFDELSLILFNTRSAQAGCNTKILIDDIKVYKSNKPLTKEKFSEKGWELAVGREDLVSTEMVKYGTQDKLVLYENAPKALVNGDPTPIDDKNNAVVPFVVNGTTLLPARFIVESLGGDIEYDEVKKEAVANIDGKVIVITEGSKTMLVDGEEKELREAARVKDGRFFVPLRALGEAVGKKVFWDKTGMIVLSDEEFDLNWREDNGYLSAIAAQMVYERPNGKEILSAMKERYPTGTHPRILVGGQDFEELKQKIATNPQVKAWYLEMKKEADFYMEKEPAKLKPDAMDWTDEATVLKEMAEELAFCYKIEGDIRYAERLMEEIQVWLDQEVWVTRAMLAMGRVGMAFGFAYDWLYDVMPESMKTDMKEAMVNKVYSEAFKDYYNIYPRLRSYEWTLRPKGDNWTTIINAGMLMTALAFGDEAGYEDVCAEIITEAVVSLENAFNQLGPDGAWYEGPGYWTSTAESMVWDMEVLRNATGTDYGLFNAPGMKYAGYYLYEMSASTGIFNFNFAAQRGYPCPILMYFGDRLGDNSLKKLAINQYEKFKGESGKWMTPSCLLLMGDLPPEDTVVNLPLDSYYRGTEAISMRSSWEENKELYAGFHSGYNGAQNAQLDIGTFVIEAYGERFITDYGPENYALPGSDFEKYMNRAEGSNCYIVNPSDDYNDQEESAYCFFDRYETNAHSVYAISDITAAYSPELKSAKRGMKMTNNRTAVILQDEIRSDEPVDIYWGMHTPATVTLSEDKKTALLEIRGNRMEAKIMSEQGEFSCDEAKPLPETHQLDGQTPHPNDTKLAMWFRDTTAVDIAICFTPLGYAEKVDIKYPEMAKLDDWKLDEPGEAPTTIVPDMSKVVLTDLKVDGETVEGFDSGKKTYSITIDSRTAPIPEITFESEYNTKLIYPDSWPGNIKVAVEAEGGTIYYEIVVNAPPATPFDYSHNEIKPISWEVYALSQADASPDNLFDYNFETRMALATPNWVMFDFGEEKNIDKLMMAFYYGNTRQTYFDIEISNDKENWTTVFDGESSGKTLDYETFDIGMQKCRYLKINGKGTNTRENWLSVLEMRLFGAK